MEFQKLKLRNYRKQHLANKVLSLFFFTIELSNITRSFTATIVSLPSAFEISNKKKEEHDTECLSLYKSRAFIVFILYPTHSRKQF